MTCVSKLSIARLSHNFGDVLPAKQCATEFHIATNGNDSAPGTNSVCFQDRTLRILGQAVSHNAEKYSYSRPCYIYIPENATAEATVFMAFIDKPEGQEIVRKVGFIPVKDLK